MNSNFFKLTLAVISIGLHIGVRAQSTSPDTKKIAVLGFDSRELAQSDETIANMARLKLQQIPNYSVFRKYDLEEEFANSKINILECFSVKCLSEAGRQIGADEMLTGSAERYGERIVINVVLIDVESESIIANNVNDYYNLGSELEGMIEISINKLFGIESDPLLLNALEKNDVVLNERVVERLRLNGPRMGVGFATGEHAKRLMDSRDQNGFEMLPVMTQFGYQFEWQYMSAGNMQALIEFIPMISGMDQGRFIPSVTFMNGFRHSGTGIEFAFGPTIRLTQVAEGYYDDNGIWRQSSYWYETQTDESGRTPDNPHKVHENLDSKGDYKLAYGFTIAAGKTIRSGHLNMPVNVYVTPNLHGVLAGASFGFNVRKKGDHQ